MSPVALLRILRLALVPAVVLVSACASPPSELGSLGGRNDDVATGGKKPGTKTPPKKTEPSEQPAPPSAPSPPATPQQDQAPTLASILPESITVGESPNGIELTLNGTRFALGSQVDIAGTKLPTTVLSAQQLRVLLPADKVKAVGSLRIAVVAKPGLESNPLSFTVSNPSTVTIASLTPASVVLGATNADVPLSVTGTGFTQQSVVRFNGAALPTTFASATSLSTTIPAIAFVATGRFSVTVATGNDVVSLPSAFEVRNPAPAATQVTPASVTAGDAATVVTISGDKFTKASEVFVQNAPLATTFVSPTQLRATVPSYLIATEGTLSLVVTTGAPGGGSSQGLPLSVKAGQSSSQAAQCAYKCADYGYTPYACYSNWYCIGSGQNAAASRRRRARTRPSTSAIRAPARTRARTTATSRATARRATTASTRTNASSQTPPATELAGGAQWCRSVHVIAPAMASTPTTARTMPRVIILRCPVRTAAAASSDASGVTASVWTESGASGEWITSRGDDAGGGRTGSSDEDERGLHRVARRARGRHRDGHSSDRRGDGHCGRRCDRRKALHDRRRREGVPRVRRSNERPGGVLGGARGDETSERLSMSFTRLARSPSASPPIDSTHSPICVAEAAGARARAPRRSRERFAIAS